MGHGAALAFGHPPDLAPEEQVRVEGQHGPDLELRHHARPLWASPTPMPLLPVPRGFMKLRQTLLTLRPPPRSARRIARRIDLPPNPKATRDSTSVNMGPPPYPGDGSRVPTICREGPIMSPPSMRGVPGRAGLDARPHGEARPPPTRRPRAERPPQDGSRGTRMATWGREVSPSPRPSLPRSGDPWLSTACPRSRRSRRASNWR